MGKTFGTPFKKGNKGGPGRKPLTEEQKILRNKLKTEHGKLTIAKYLFGNYSKLKKAIADGKLGKTPVLDLLVARVIERGISKADVRVLETMFDRVGWEMSKDEKPIGSIKIIIDENDLSL